MKKFTLVVAVLCIVAMFGCAKKQSDDVIKNVAGTNNAPTLWPVYEKNIRAYVDKDWNAAWDLASSDNQKSFGEGLDAAKKVSTDDLKKQKADMQKELDAATDAQVKASFQSQMTSIDQEIADHDKIQSMDAKAYFIYTMYTAMKDANSHQSKSLADLAKQKIEIVKETINGDKGTLTQKVDGKEETISFVKENGTWKIGG